MTDKIIQTWSEAHELGWSNEKYYAQFNPIDLALDQLYIQHKGTWQEKIYKIIFVGEGVAVGIVTDSKLKPCIGNKQMFIANGLRGGWAHNDNRPSYRLQEIDQ